MLKPLHKCHCGEMRYGGLRGDDGVYCKNCGAMYLIDFPINPVAMYEWVDDERTNMD